MASECRQRGAALRGAVLLAAFALTALLPAADASGQASWRLEQPPPPEGAPFRVPLGTPGDLQFWSRNRGLLGVEGNATVPRGIYYWNGETWRQLATVCGGPADTMRIAWAGPTEFWTVSEPSRPRLGSGLALCRFKDGQVVASYSTPNESPDPYREMSSATCNGPNDCWFGGVGSQDPAGTRVGAFHLHWDGATLATVYGPQGRGVSDLKAQGGTIFESVFVGRNRDNSTDSPDLAEPESPKPRLIHRIAGTRFSNDPFVAASRAGVPDDGTELLALDGDGTRIWAAGGGATSGPPARATGYVARPPLAARMFGDVWRELELDTTPFDPSERFTDIAAVPGTDGAWAAVQRYDQRRSANAFAKVARITAPTCPVAPPATCPATVQVETIPSTGSGRGNAAKVAFTAPNDGWLVTWSGWLFHFTDGSAPPRDEEPAFQGTITSRPCESCEQFIPDDPPPDDSLLFAPPPVEIEPPLVPPEPIKLKPLLRNVRSKLRGRTLTITFTLSRRAKVALIARRKKRVVAQTKMRTFKKGRRSLHLKLNPRRWPTRLSFKTKELESPAGGGGGDGTGTDTGTTPSARR